MEIFLNKDLENNRAIKDCLKNLSNSHSLCVEAVKYCLIQGGPYAEMEHIRILIDCSEICRLTADFILRDSDAESMLANISANICDNCADSCARFADDERLILCSKACRECAESCREVISQEHKETEHTII